TDFGESGNLWRHVTTHQILIIHSPFVHMWAHKCHDSDKQNDQCADDRGFISYQAAHGIASIADRLCCDFLFFLDLNCCRTKHVCSDFFFFWLCHYESPPCRRILGSTTPYNKSVTKIIMTSATV